MKVWIDNLVKNEKIIPDEEIAAGFKKSKYATEEYKVWPLIRCVLAYLSDMHYAFEQSDLQKLMSKIEVS